jgi:predicted nucleic-acid-binding protein
VIGLDTNVIVRYLTQDDPRQARKATALIEAGARRGDRFHLGVLVLCEVVWVLRGAYDFDKETIVSVLDRILATEQFEIGEKDLVRVALEEYRSGKGDFADYLIGHANRETGCEFTATFDGRLKEGETFRVLS